MAQAFPEPPVPPSLLAVDVDDAVLLSRLAALASSRGLQLVRIDDPRLSPGGDLPIAVAIDLDASGAVDRILTYRQRWPLTLMAGSIGFPDQERWHGALAAGADLVANRGAFTAQLSRALEDRSAGAGGRPGAVVRLQVRLMERDGDGLVGRLPDAPGGSIVILRVSGELHAIRDECPHAGASLSDGPLDGTIITCPRHGSQFDVTTGARERGPSDFPIRTYRVITVDGATFVDVPT